MATIAMPCHGMATIAMAAVELLNSSLHSAGFVNLNQVCIVSLLSCCCNCTFSFQAVKFFHLVSRSTAFSTEPLKTPSTSTQLPLCTANQSKSLPDPRIHLFLLSFHRYRRRLKATTRKDGNHFSMRPSRSPIPSEEMIRKDVKRIERTPSPKPPHSRMTRSYDPTAPPR